MLCVRTLVSDCYNIGCVFVFKILWYCVSVCVQVCVCVCVCVQVHVCLCLCSLHSTSALRFTRPRSSFLTIVVRLSLFQHSTQWVHFVHWIYIVTLIIGQSIYNIPAFTYLLETEIFSIVKYQLKCCSIANDAAPDCHMVWPGAVCCRQGHQRVAWMAARLCESWWTTLWTFALSRELLFSTDFTVL